MNIVITAGGTSEKIDNVRKITNSSTGKLGCEIAKEFLKQSNVKVFYICSKTAMCPTESQIWSHSELEIIRINDVQDLKNAVEKVLKENKIDYFIHTMAVSDYTTDYVTTMDKIKNSFKQNSNSDDAINNIEKLTGNKLSSNEGNLVIVLKPTPKIISLIKKLSPNTMLIGFKLLDGVEHEELLNVAKALRDKNNCDYVVANDLKNIRSGNHTAYIIDKEDFIKEVSGKTEIAKALVGITKNTK